MAAIAIELAKGQKEISVAEFFERNRQILGFDSPTKALITSVKEAVDNAIDACEEANILPDIDVTITPTKHDEEYTLTIEDNGPGVIKKQMPNIFARLLYGSRFHAIRQSRGQQGIGISAVVLYGQITTGNYATVTSKIGPGHPAVRMGLGIDTKTNRAKEHFVEADHWDKPHGTRIEVVLKGRYQGGKQSVFEYLRSTSIVNPHARITFTDPKGETFVFDRASDDVPPKTETIKPHPLGTELGTILKMAAASEFRKMSTFLQKEFSSVGGDTAKKLLAAAELENIKPEDLTRDEARRLHDAFAKVKIMAPPTDCLAPIGEALVRQGLKKETTDVSPEYITTVTRPPSVWGGHPFQVEVGIVYGGTLPKDSGVRILRFANRVPLLYQQGGCEGTLGIQDVDWRRYGLEQRGGKGIPVGPAIILVHVASTKVPFTSEAKEAIAPMEEIHKELKLALQEAARGLGRHLKKKEKRKKVSEKFDLVTKILPEINKKAAAMLQKPEVDLAPIVCKIMDVVWIEDPTTEYTKLEGQILNQREIDAAHAANADSGAVSKATIAKGAGGTLDAFDEDSSLEGEDDAVQAFIEPPKPKQAYVGKATVQITNYKQKAQKFKLYMVVPDNSVFVEADPEPKAVHERYVMWEMPTMKPAEVAEISLQMGGIEKGGLDNLEAYVDGINDIHVVGADPWRGGDDA